VAIDLDSLIGKLNQRRILNLFHMRRKRRKNSIAIDPPRIDVDNLLKDTTVEERFRVFEILDSNCRYQIALLMFSGALSTIFSVLLLAGVQVFSSSLSFVALFAMGLIGVANIICGFLLLASE